jgi:hypothetical protein
MSGTTVAMQPRRRGRCALIVLAVFVGVIALASSAFAYFTTGGAGAGSARTGTVAAPTVVSATATANLLPTGGFTDLSVTLNNTNSFSVRITGIQQTGTVTIGAGAGTCTTSGVSVPTNSGLSFNAGAGNGVVVTLPAVVKMDTTSDNGCQGRTFTFPIKLTVVKP